MGSVEIIAHRKTRDSMNDPEAEKRIRTRNLFGNEAAIADVTSWRKPDRVFEGDFMELDLGDRKVQLWHFGPGNTPGDTIVYVAEAKVAWTGNFLSNEQRPSKQLIAPTFSGVTVQSGLASQLVDQELSSLEYFVDLSGVGQGTRSL